MKRKPLQLGLAAAALLATLTISSCQKQLNDNTATEEQTETVMLSAEDDAEAEVTFGEAGDQVIGADAELGMGQFDLLTGANTDNADDPADYGRELTDSTQPVSRCVTITVSPRNPGVFPKTISIDYGRGCRGRDGKVRSGKIVTVYSNPLVVPGATAVTEFIDYHVDSVKVEGRLSIKNNSTNATLVMTRSVQGGKLTKPNGNYIKWEATHTYTQTAGLGTPGYPRDDEWAISGGARGECSRNRNVVTWSRVITERLHKAFTCRWIDRGVVKITVNNVEAILNYGNGTCDNKATITKGGVTREITLR
jgi:hypothetical protein